MAGRTQLAPTFLDILKDSITKVAEVYWAPYNLNKKEFDIKGMITYKLFTIDFLGFDSQGFPGNRLKIIAKKLSN